MRGLSMGTKAELYDIQCAACMVIRLYEQPKARIPDRAAALAYGKSFDPAAWNTALRGLLGSGAEAIIALEEKEYKYSLPEHQK